MFRNSDKSRQQKLLYLEQHPILYLSQMLLQEETALLQLEDILLCKLFDNNQNSNLGLLFHILTFLMFTVHTYSIHDYLDDFYHQILGLLQWNVLLAEAQQSFNSFVLDGFIAQHQHSRGQWEDVYCNDVYYLWLWDEDLGFKQLFEQFIQILEQFQLQIILFT